MNQQETFDWLVERSNRLDEAESRVAALTAEKEAMREVVIATERYLCTDSPSVRDKCKVWDALDALQKQRRQSAFEALTPKPPTDSTERKVE